MSIPTPELLRRALAGDEAAAREYCGSYKLVMLVTSDSMYRTKVVSPPMKEIKEYGGYSVYDDDGYLKPVFWALPRL